MNKQNVVFPVFVVVVVIVAGGQAAEILNRLREDTISKDLHEAPLPIASAAAAKNAIVSAPSGPASTSSKILNAVAGDSTVAAAVRGKDSPTAVEGAATAAVKDSVIVAVGNPNEAAVHAEGEANNNNNNEQRQSSTKLLKLSEKSPSISSQTAHSEKVGNNEHSVGERIEKVMPVKENTVATHAGKGGGGSSSSLKVAAQMVGVYQHNKR